MTDKRDDPTLMTSTPASDPSSSVRRAAIPETLGRYTIVRLLGRGGVGSVYEAEDPDLDRRVAIKVLREDRGGDTEDLKREAKALARLVHQNVVTVHDVGEANGEVFVVMQLVEGEPIDRWALRRKATHAEILAKFEQAGHGLMAAHAAGLVHCDFKPGNVLIDKQGVVRVSDFGLARMTRSLTSLAPGAVIAPIAGMTTIAGTPAYMAPEQFGGMVTAASDQFAYCVALWECLVGRRPFDDDSKAIDADAWRRRVAQPIPRDVRVAPHVMKALLRGLADTPEERYPTMTALLEALKPRRAWWPIAIAGGAIGAAAGGVAMYLATGSPEKPPVWSGADVTASVALTSFGEAGCAYAPAIMGDRVVFDRTEGDRVDLYEVPIGGGAARQLTAVASTWEWRAQPGRRDGEVVYLIHDPKDTSRARIAFLDLATGTSTPALDRLAWDAVVVGDSLYYSPDEPSGIRVLRGKQDLSLVKPPPGESFVQIGVSPVGDKLALTNSNTNNGPSRACIVELATKAVRCLEGLSTVTRPAFGVGGRALYASTSVGIVRRDLETDEQTVIVPGVFADGGLSVARDGRALAYSTCYEHTVIADATTGEKLVDDETATYPSKSSKGVLAWVRELRGPNVLMVRFSDGRELQLTEVEQGSVRFPRFSPDGSLIAFGMTAPNPGIHVVELARPGKLRKVSNNERDTRPIWLADSTLAFARTDESANARVYLTTADGGNTRAVATSTRTAYGSRVVDGRHELLLGGAESFYWYDVAGAVEREGPPKPAGDYIASANVSPSGAWIVYEMGANSQEVWRLRVEGGALERVPMPRGMQTLGHVTISDDGRILGAAGRWYGDLVLVPAKPGETF